MDSTAAEELAHVSEEMVAFAIKTVLQRNGPRVGRLACQSRVSISTPNYVAITSRGVVPHLSQDNISRHTSIRSLYFGLEDFVEKQAPRVPPIYNTQTPSSDDSKLCTFTANPQETLLILGPRRFPPIESPQSNSSKNIAICTSTGFQYLSTDDYATKGGDLRPDILLAPADLPNDANGAPSQKRVEKMGDRTTTWLRDAIAHKEVAREKGDMYALFAPILPVPLEAQQWYLRELAEDLKDGVNGLYVHDAASLMDLPSEIASLPRLGFLKAKGISDLLYQISCGIDLVATPFIGAATDAGIALTFQFPGPSNSAEERQQIGVSLWDPSHSTDVSPFAPNCECYACTKHHRAYLHHLLNAKEMLAWVLLQIHNYQVMDKLFAAVRNSIAQGTFDADRAAFDKFYEPELPQGVEGKGPRIRGYQTKSVGQGERKKNTRAFNKLDDMAEALAEAADAGAVPEPNLEATELKEHGLGDEVGAREGKKM